MITMKSGSEMGLVRKNNEDIVMTKHYPDLDLAVICDGLGGQPAGEVASAIAATIFTGKFDAMIHDDIPDLINRATDAANDAVLLAAKSNTGFTGMGCTLTGVAFKGPFAYIFNVGDSRVYRLRNNCLDQLTEDDNELTEAIKDGTYEPGVPLKHNGLTKVIGSYWTVEPAIQVQRLRQNDRFLVCSDGLYNMVSDEKMEGVLMISGVDRAVEDLTKLAMANGGYDNCSLIVAKYDAPKSEKVTPLFTNDELNKIATETKKGTPNLLAGINKDGTRTFPATTGDGMTTSGKTPQEKAAIRSTLTEAEKDYLMDELNDELGLPEKHYIVTQDGTVVEANSGEVVDTFPHDIE